MRLPKQVLLGSEFPGTSKPYTRWWWLAGPFTREDINRQLRWLRDNGFGGVELAWIFPGWYEEPALLGPRPEWLGSEWSELVSFTKQSCEALGLGCDFTFGSSWPFGGSGVLPGDAAQTFTGASTQRLGGSWEPEGGLIVNHLSAASLGRYAKPLLEALKTALAGAPSALFCDSLELATEGLWSEGLWPEFEDRFGYSLRTFADALKRNPDVRYDYRKLISDTIRVEFYEAFTAICRENGAYSRVQCHGAPTDLLQAYAAVDVPESESLLFAPGFSRIAASAAAWAGKPVVSAETFTCIYGFPGWNDASEHTWKREDLGDLKLLADALFASGVNQIIWHGMPFQPFGEEIEFYASVHVGPDSPFSPRLPEFNAYLRNCSSLMRTGVAYPGVGVYLPFEDALMLDRLPENSRTPGANYHWEMRHAVPPVETEGHAPLWISAGFLREAEVDNGLVCSRQLRLPGLYFDCAWLDADALEDLLRLAQAGAHLIFKRRPKQPGHVASATYEQNLDTVFGKARSGLQGWQPLLSGEVLPPYWARQDGDRLILFFAHPKAREITFPMAYQLSASATPVDLKLAAYWSNREVHLDLHFERNESLVVQIDAEGTAAIISGQLPGLPDGR